MTAKRAWRRRGVPVLAGVAATLVVVCNAFGFWTAIGHGTASGDATGGLAITVSPGTPAWRLYPGGQTDVALEIANPNPYVVHLGSFSLDTGQGDGGFDVDGAHGACPASALAFATQSNGGAGWSVGPRVGSTDGSLAIDLSSALGMSMGAADGCQGASFTVYLVAGP
jgi:hypothetical protein